MAADLVTRLLLQNEQFDRTLKQSQAQIKAFEGGIKKLSSGVKTSFLAFTGAAGIAVGGMELVKKTIMSTQTTGDAFQKQMDITKSSVDAFFTSLAMGDVSVFLSNLQSVIDKAGEYADVMDELETKELYSGRDLSKLTSEMQIQLNLSKDRTKSIEERNKALEEARKLQEKINAITTDLGNQRNKTAYATIRLEMAKQGYKYELPEQLIDEMFSEGKRGKLTEYHDKVKKMLADIRAYEESLRAQSMAGGDVSKTTYDNYVKAKNVLEDYLKTSEGVRAERAYYWGELSDDSKSALAAADKLFAASEQARVSVSNAALQLANSEAKINSAENKQAKIDAIYPDGSMGKIEQQIKELQKKWDEAADEGTRAGIRDAIESLEKEKHLIEMEYEIRKSEKDIRNSIEAEVEGIYKNNPVTVGVPIGIIPYADSEEVGEWEVGLPASIEATQLEIQEATLKYNKATTDELRAIYAQRRADLEKHLQEMTEVNDALLDITQMVNGSMTSALTDSLESIASDENFSEWLIKMMDLLSQFGKSLVAAGLAKLAFDKLIVNPWAAIAAGGVLIAVAASARSALQNAATPMASGGVVYGETLARVGEYPGAASNPEVVAPLDKLRDLLRPSGDLPSSGEVVFRIEGRELVGVLNNYNKRQSRIR